MEAIVMCASSLVSPAYSVSVIFKIQMNEVTDALICGLSDTANTS